MEKKFNQWIQLLRCTELSGNERIVLALILNYHNNENWDNTSLKTLKKDSGLTAPTIAKCVKVLEDKGLIKTVISSYKKNINPTNDYLPNYETIQQMIDKHNGNCVLGMKETCIRDTEGMKEICVPNTEGMKETCIDVSKNFTHGYERNFTTGMKETCNKYNIKDNIKEKIEKENKENPENPVIENPETNSFSDSEVNEIIDSPNNLQKEKENPENPVNGNQKSNFISDFSNSVDSPNIVDETDEDTDNPKCDSPKSNSDSKSKPYRVNLNYIDDLERQFNGYTDATSPNAAENSPKATANPNLTSDYINELSCVFPKKNPSIMLDLIEAVKRPALVIDALDKANDWVQTYRCTKDMKLIASFYKDVKDIEYIAQVYVNASNTINSKNGMSEKKRNYASDYLELLRKNIITCGCEGDLKNAMAKIQ